MTHCAQIPYTEPDARLFLQCNTGMLNIDAIDRQTESRLFDIGIINSSQGLPTYCSNSAFTDKFKCSSFVDRDAFMVAIHNQCHGKSSCQIKNPSQFVHVLGAAINQDECAGLESTMFVQIGCVLPDDKIHER